jgi:hypothetical protein
MTKEQITIEIAQASDLPQIETLLRDLMDEISNTENLGLKIALDNCRKMMDDAAKWK